MPFVDVTDHTNEQTTGGFKDVTESSGFKDATESKKGFVDVTEDSHKPHDTVAFGKAAVEGLLPNVGGLGGAVTAVAAAAPIEEAAAAINPILGLVTTGLVGLGGAFGGGWLGEKATEEIKKAVGDEALEKSGFDPETRAREQRQSPKSTFAGGFVGGLVGFGPGAIKPIVNAVGKEVVSAGAQRAFMGGVGSTIEATQEVLGEDKIDPWKIAFAGAWQSFAAKPTKAMSILETHLGIKRGEGSPDSPEKFEEEHIKDAKNIIGVDLAQRRVNEVISWQQSNSLKELLPDQKDREALWEKIQRKQAEKITVTQERVEYTPEEIETRANKEAKKAYRDARKAGGTKDDWMKANTTRYEEVKKAMAAGAKEVKETKTYEPLLTGKEKEAFDLYKSFTKETGERAEKLGIIDGLLEHYATRIIDFGDMEQSTRDALMQQILNTEHPIPGTKTTSRYSKHRTAPDFGEFMDKITSLGLKLKTTDLAHVHEIYSRSMLDAITNKEAIEGLRKVRTEPDLIGADGVPVKRGDPVLVNMMREGVPHGYKVIEDNMFKGFAVHPDVYPAMKHMLAAREPGPIIQALSILTNAIKRLNVSWSLFHAKSLIEAHILAGGLDQKGSIGMKESLRMFAEAHPDVLEAIMNGLIIGTPEDVTRGVLGTSGKLADEFLSKFGYGKEYMEKAMTALETKTMGKLDKFTWDYLHTGLKINTYLKYLEKMQIDHPEEFKTAEGRAKQIREITRMINNTYGGLDWYDIARQSTTKLGEALSMAAFSPEGRRNLQLLLFAPDWTISTFRAFSTALPKSLSDPSRWDFKGGVKGLIKPKTQGDLARRYQARLAVTYLTAMNLANWATSGRNIWENQDPTRLEFKDGTSVQLAKHAMEPWHMFEDSDKAIANKLGFFPKAFTIGLTGTEYASPYAPKLKDNTVTGRLKAALSGALPFQVQGAMGGKTLTEGLIKGAAGMGGFPVYGKGGKPQGESSDFHRKTAAALDRPSMFEETHSYPNKDKSPGEMKENFEMGKQGRRPLIRDTDAIKARMLKESGYKNVNPANYELDHIVPRSLGGSDSESNLFPMSRYGKWNADKKDDLEYVMLKMVKNNEISLKGAQQVFKDDWVEGYKMYVPSHEHYVEERKRLGEAD